MKCPVCKTASLTISERKGIEIDFCPECRGVWLDRGELDKILERSREEFQSESAERSREQDRDRERERERESYRPHHDDKYYKYKRRKSFLEELFD